MFIALKNVWPTEVLWDGQLASCLPDRGSGERCKLHLLGSGKASPCEGFLTILANTGASFFQFFWRESWPTRPR